MSTPPLPTDVGRVLRDAFRFVNPFEPDVPPPDPPVCRCRRRVYGGAGALVAMAAVASLNVEAIEGATRWQIVIYAVIVVGLMLAGMSMGERLTERASYKIFFGALIATLAVIVVIRTLLTAFAVAAGW